MKLKIMGVVAVLAAALWAPLPAGAANKTVRVVHPPVGDMWPYFVAKTDGIFEKNGLDVTTQIMAVSSNVPAALVSGSAELGTLTLATLLPAIENGLDLVVVAGGTKADANLVTELMVKPDSGIKTAKDLEGKKIGVPGRGAFLEVLLKEWLEKKGANPEKVTLVEVPFPQMFDTLRAGTVDAVTVVEPFVSRIKGTKTGVSIAPFIADLGSPYRVLVTVATREYAEKNPDVIKALRASLQEAEKVMAADVEKVRGSVGQFIKMPPEALKAVKFAGSPVPVTDAEIDEWTTLMIKQGSLKKNTPASKFNIK